MPYSRPDPYTPDALDGFSDFLKSAAGLVQRVSRGAQQVQTVAQQVEAQIPNVDAIVRQPRAAAQGAIAAARTADAGGSFLVEHPILAALGAAVLVGGLVKLVRR